MTILDLFSGIGGFSLALQNVYDKPIKHLNSDINKYANQVYKYHFKNSINYESVKNIQSKELPKIDIITFGSPCQDFSLAGKRRGLEGERSSLISEAIKLISECRPSFFIWENVKGTFSSNNGEDFWAIIKAFANIGGYRLEWQLLNTKWFLPQNRERIYLVGCIAERCKQKIFPITETNFNFTEKIWNKTRKSTSEQNTHSRTISSRIHKMGNDDTYINVIDKKGNEKNRNYASTLVASYHKHPSDSDYLLINSNTKKGYEKIKKGDSINYTNLSSKTRRGRVGKSVAQNLDTMTEQAVFENNIRRLTPIECERLQGFPDNWTKYGTKGLISDTQRYRMCGNAVTVDVVEEIFKRILCLKKS